MLSKEGQLDRVLEKIRSVRNFDFRNYKRATLKRRIERRITERGCHGYDEYLNLLEQQPEEVDALISSMLIKLTSFYRDPEIWQAMQQKVLPEILKAKQPNEELRIWSAGCSTGEEAYSLAIAVAEALGTSVASHEIKVFGTDVDEAAVAHARRGKYSALQVQGLPKGVLSRWFIQGADGYSVKKEIRRMVVFGVNNLVSDAPVSRIDLILCRNVFIYLDAELQKRVLARFHFALRHKGFLVLGKSELIPFASKIFEPVDIQHRIYRKDSRREVPLSAQERLVGLLEQENLSRATDQTKDKLSVLGQYYRDVLDSAPCPTITTAMDGTITYWNRAAARLWGRGEAEVFGKKLATLGLPGLSGELLVEKSALVRARRSDREASEGSVEARQGSISVRAEVMPLQDMANETLGLLYVVHDVSALRNLETELRRANDEQRETNDQLQSSVEELRSSNEELETTNEELQSANEELQTTNEELQTTNEELETTNEELQSTNAELDATNRELAHRTEEMNLLSFYQRTIIRSLSAAVVVLDPHGRISTWNLASERLLGLTEREAVGQLLWTLHIPAIKRALLARIRKSLTDNRSLRLEEVPYQLPTGGKGFATVVATPLVEEEVNLGAVIVFEDTTRASSRVEENRRLKERRRG